MPSERINPVVVTAAVVVGGILAFLGVKAMTPKGIRNNNLGNIRYTGVKWRGLREDEPQDEKGFCRFESAFFGLRALCVNTLSLYQKGVRSLLDYTSLWAPSTDGNKPEEYAKFLAARTGAESIRVRFNFTDPMALSRLSRAVTRFENGFDPYAAEMHEAAAAEALRYKGYI